MSKIKGSAGCVSDAGSPFGWQTAPSCSVIPCTDPLVSSYKDTDPIGSGPHP